jgi:hypothetical protein
MDLDLLRRKHDLCIDDTMVEDARRMSLVRRGLL